MVNGYFYFLKDSFFDKFSNYGVMPNKSIDEQGNVHGRPYYYAVKDIQYDDILWMIPISSKVLKYEQLCKKKFEKYHKPYDGIAFGNVNGNKRAFLLQNMCPVIKPYIDSIYKSTNDNRPIILSPKTTQYIIGKSQKLIELSKRGKKCTLTDIPYIYAEILKELHKEE